MSQYAARHSNQIVPFIGERKRTTVLRLGKHLTKEEFVKYRPAKNWTHIVPILSRDLHELSQLGHYLELSPIQQDYMLLLAFLQKNSLPFEIAFPRKIMLKSFPFKDSPNFQFFDELYDRHYPRMYPMDSDQVLKAKRKLQVFHIVASLWFAGYALKAGLGGVCILTSNVLEDARKLTNYTRRSCLTILEKCWQRKQII